MLGVVAGGMDAVDARNDGSERWLKVLVAVERCSVCKEARHLHEIFCLCACRGEIMATVQLLKLKFCSRVQNCSNSYFLK